VKAGQERPAFYVMPSKMSHTCHERAKPPLERIMLMVLTAAGDVTEQVTVPRASQGTSSGAHGC
jgi:hypothetical protein